MLTESQMVEVELSDLQTAVVLHHRSLSPAVGPFWVVVAVEDFLTCFDFLPVGLEADHHHLVLLDSSLNFLKITDGKNKVKLSRHFLYSLISTFLRKFHVFHFYYEIDFVSRL